MFDAHFFFEEMPNNWENLTQRRRLFMAQVEAMDAIIMIALDSGNIEVVPEYQELREGLLKNVYDINAEIHKLIEQGLVYRG